mmetsp:Transcript_17893/g.31322  ORF Transcript_17893/g.31322 Transcript_17893/m.31322 type:complete len:270 (-) Transcript_17893:658-1467(-)
MFVCWRHWRMWIVKTNSQEKWIALFGQSFQSFVGHVTCKMGWRILFRQGKLSQHIGLRDFINFKSSIGRQGRSSRRLMSCPRIELNGSVRVARVGIVLLSLLNIVSINQSHFLKMFEVPLIFTSIRVVHKEKFISLIIVIVVMNQIVILLLLLLCRVVVVVVNVMFTVQENIRNMPFSIIFRKVSLLLHQYMIQTDEGLYPFRKPFCSRIFLDEIVVLNAVSFNGSPRSNGGPCRCTDGTLTIGIFKVRSTLQQLVQIGRYNFEFVIVV